MPREHGSGLKQMVQGFETLNQDDSQLLNSALDSGDLSLSCCIMYNICVKEFMTNRNPRGWAFLDSWCNRDRTNYNEVASSSVSRKNKNRSNIRETTGNSNTGQKDENTTKNCDSGNKCKDQGKPKKGKKRKDGRKK